MTSSFFGIETMRRAILSQRTVMNTIGHNVANASTEGYSRQVVHLTSTSPTPTPGTNLIVGAGQLGTGVAVAEIERVRDVFVDNKLRSGLMDQGYNQVVMDTLSQIENAFLEPSTEQGFSNAMSEFFTAWQDLSINPESAAARNQVVSMAQNLVDVVNNIDQTLRGIRLDLNGQLKQGVDEVNRIIEEIATLNYEITKVYSHNNLPNDLLDQRDLLLDELSQYVNFDVIDTDVLGGISISIGGRELVRDDSVYNLTYDTAWDHPSQNSKTPYMNDVSQNDFYMLAQASNGELKGIIEARDEILVEVSNEFSSLVTEFMNTVNNYCSQGMGMVLEDTGTITTSVADITSLDNFVAINATEITQFSTGELIYIEDADGEGITVEITDIDVSGGVGRLFFDNIGPLVTADEATGTQTSFSGAANGIESGATIRKITMEKYNLFETADILGRNMIGDTNADYYSQMTSTLKLPEGITAKTTIRELEAIYGVDITDMSGKRLQLDDQGYSKMITEDMTLDQAMSIIAGQNLVANDGKALEVEFDEVNRRIIIKGETAEALNQLGGEDGSSCNLLRVLGFEGYGIAGFEQETGTNLTTTLEDLGIGDGYIQIDNVLLEIDKSMTIQATLDQINATLNVDPDQSSYGTNLIWDANAGRLRIVSSHRFSVRTPEESQIAAAGGAIASNFLTILGLQRDETVPTDSMQQQLASVTSSDIGARITVNQDIINDTSRLATATSYAGIPGDNTVALDIAGIQNQYLMSDYSTGSLANPSETLEEFYSGLISDIGVDSQRAIMDAEVIDNYLEFYQNKREEVSGVSLDEEMTKMIEAQHAFSAASRMINTVDEMLDLIINGTGLVGR
ncbi:MAG TPA: flagellar hook-associated protein FlgK [bacterium]|nr:flagellar hook-associated protein FlgK [bacterium]